MLLLSELISVSDKELDATIRRVLEEEYVPVEDGPWQRLSRELDIYCERLKAQYLTNN